MAVSLAGMDPIGFLECEDGFRVRVMLEVARRHAAARDVIQENEATRIANAVGKMLGG